MSIERTESTDGSYAATARAGRPPLRTVRPRESPTISIVLATRRTDTELRDDLQPLLMTCAQLEAELVVIGPHSSGVTGRMVSRHVRSLSAPADATLCHLRALAMAEVAGDIVVLLDDSRGESTTWTERVRLSQGSTESRLVGRRHTDWSSYLEQAMTGSR